MATLPVIATAIPIGIAFGVILERAGLGDARVIRGQLTGQDFTVVRVMFGAIVVAMLGVLWGSALGLIDAKALAIPPTDLAAQAVGAVIFGGGFALAALCPGTACVAAASGRRDGIVAVAGVFVGTLALPIVWPAVGAAAAEAPREGATLASDLGWPVWSIAVIVTALAIVGSMVARRVAARQADVRWWQLTRVECVGLTLAVALIAVEGKGTPNGSNVALAAIAGEIAREEDHVDPIDLAEQIHEGREGLRIIDVREGLDTSIYVIPGAERVELTDVATLPVAPDEHVVLYSDGGTHAAQAWVLLRTRGVNDVRVLKDGMAAWEDEVLSPAIPPAGDSVAQRDFARVRELSLWFGGRPRLSDAADAPALPSAIPASATPANAREASAKAKRRRNTC